MIIGLMSLKKDSGYGKHKEVGAETWEPLFLKRRRERHMSTVMYTEGSWRIRAIRKKFLRD